MSRNVMLPDAPVAYVIGEALVDVVGGTRRPGGSPLNVAVGLGRLGIPTVLHSMIGADDDGRAIQGHLRASGVELSAGTRVRGTTARAEALVGVSGTVDYEIDLTWDPAPPDASGYQLTHLGSIGAWLAPGADTVERALESAAGVVSFDPNVRPALMGERRAAVGRVERLVARSHIVKASDQDVQWLYPGESPDEVLRRWAQLGPSLVVVTRGASGADALSDGAMLHVDAPAASVVDTIGAGDSFMAALLAFVIREGMARPQAAIEFAARCAAITVSRAGADPPRLTDLE